MLISIVIDGKFNVRPSQTKDYTICIYFTFDVNNRLKSCAFFPR